MAGRSIPKTLWVQRWPLLAAIFTLAAVAWFGPTLLLGPKVAVELALLDRHGNDDSRQLRSDIQPIETELSRPLHLSAGVPLRSITRNENVARFVG